MPDDKLPRDKSEYYIDPDLLRQRIREYKALLVKDEFGKPILDEHGSVVMIRTGDRMPDALGKMLLDIANKISNLPCFNGYSFKEEFISDAILKMVKNAHRIDPDDPRSPFSYLSLCCIRCSIARIKREKRQREISERCAVQMFSGLIEDGEIDGVVKSFEDWISDDELMGDTDIDANS